MRKAAEDGEPNGRAAWGQETPRKAKYAGMDQAQVRQLYNQRVGDRRRVDAATGKKKEMGVNELREGLRQKDAEDLRHAAASGQLWKGGCQ